MFPEEKAQDLIVRFYILPDEVAAVGNLKGSDSRQIAKRCAIICVEQIMVAIENVAGGYDTHWEDKEEAAFEYYKEVLEHIKNS